MVKEISFSIQHSSYIYSFYHGETDVIYPLLQILKPFLEWPDTQHSVKTSIWKSKWKAKKSFLNNSDSHQWLGHIFSNSEMKESAVSVIFYIQSTLVKKKKKNCWSRRVSKRKEDQIYFLTQGLFLLLAIKVKAKLQEIRRHKQLLYFRSFLQTEIGYFATTL